MPELPEVETIRRQLAPHLQGSTIVEVEILDPRWTRPTAPAEGVELSQARHRARAARDYAEADRLRDEIRSHGWEVRDGPDGPVLLPAA